MAWRDEYDKAQRSQTLTVVAFGVAAGIWAVNLIDSAGGFPHTVARPIRLARSGTNGPTAHPHLTFRNGAPHYGLRLSVTF